MRSQSGEEIQLFVETVIRAIVDQPENVKVSVLESGSMAVVEVSADRRDIGKVIGREGRMAQSLRVLLTALATKLGRKAVLQIIEK